MHKATIQVEDKTITFEGPREFVEAMVRQYLQATSKQQDLRLSVPTPGQETSHHSDEEFVIAKSPKGHGEIVAVLAFLLHEKGFEEFTERQLRQSYIDANMRPPKVVGQALRDAKNKQGFIAYGKKRGMYKLSDHGDRTVRFDLPR
jgi:hypothetical protein